MQTDAFSREKPRFGRGFLFLGSCGMFDCFRAVRAILHDRQRGRCEAPGTMFGTVRHRSGHFVRAPAASRLFVVWTKSSIAVPMGR
jgi:hypothetical protein